MLHTKLILRQYLVFLLLHFVSATIDGLSYMDPINMRPLPNKYEPGEDPCNPLYWYPRNIPEYCYHKNLNIPKPAPPVPPLTVPIPVPMPPQQPNLIVPCPSCSLPYPPLPYGTPMLPPNPMIPPSIPVYPQVPYPSPDPNPYPYLNPYPNSYPYGTSPQQTGMVPGLPGIVSQDGGINILPFSDVYSDLLENHKNKMIRRRLEKLIHEYEMFPNGRSFRRLRKYVYRST